MTSNRHGRHHSASSIRSWYSTRDSVHRSIARATHVIMRRFIDEVLSALGMTPLGELGIYPAVDQSAPGWSFIQPITTSHVSAH